MASNVQHGDGNGGKGPRGLAFPPARNHSNLVQEVQDLRSRSSAAALRGAVPPSPTSAASWAIAEAVNHHVVRVSYGGPGDGEDPAAAAGGIAGAAPQADVVGHFQLPYEAAGANQALFLDHRSRDEVSLLVSARTSGATPLLMACRNGHLDVVEYLVEKCQADIDQSGAVTFDGETIEGAPPLWVAAAAGHLPIVRYLVARGASVNCTTKTNSTPLRAACFDGHLEIVRFLVEHGADIEVANRHGHTCLMIACYKGHVNIAGYLLQLGADVNRKSVKGNTALHDCAESGSLDIMQILIKHGAKMDVDSYGMTPLLAAAVTGHAHIVEYLANEKGFVSRKERIDAYELLGATYVDKKRDMLGALRFWKLAMEDRHEGGPPVLHKPQGLSPIAAFENSTEASTMEQLEEAVSDPDEMRMQALLVRERILGPAHPETSYYIRFRGAVYADTGNFQRCIRLWMYALEMQQSMLEPLSPMTQSSLLSFAELFSFMMAERTTGGAYRVRETNAGGAINSHRGEVPLGGAGGVAPPPEARISPPRPYLRNPPHVPTVAFADVMAVLNRAIREVKIGALHLNKLSLSDRDNSSFHRTLIIVLNLAFLLAKMQPHFTTAQDYALKKVMFDLIKLHLRGRNGFTLLHLACAKDASAVGRYPICSFPSPEVINLLLETGADPNAMDDAGNTPLHVLAWSRPCPPSAALALLKRGAHLDRINGEGKTFGDLLGQNQRLHDILPSVKYNSLQCLAAKVVRRYGLPYKGVVPVNMESFLAFH